jgi:hypothetical protein
MQPIPREVEPDERRDAQRVGLDGRYTLRVDPCDGRDPITCALLDYSVTGARLQLPEDMALPVQVQVLIGELSHHSRIVWRNGTTVGVDFVDEHHSIF